MYIFTSSYLRYSLTPLDLASYEGHLQVVHLLTGRGSEVECRDEVRQSHVMSWNDVRLSWAEKTVFLTLNVPAHVPLIHYVECFAHQVISLSEWRSHFVLVKAPLHQASRPHPSSRNPVVYEHIYIRCLNRFVAWFSSSDHSVNSSVCYCVCHNSFDNKLNFTPRHSIFSTATHIKRLLPIWHLWYCRCLWYAHASCYK